MRLARLASALFVLSFIAVADASAQDAQSRLWDAAIAGDTTAIRKAVSDGAKIDSLDTRRSQNGRYALNWATWNNHVAAVKLLIELDAPLEAENLTGFTALHHAAENGSADAAQILLAAGANPDHTNKMGYTPQEIAAERGHDAIAKMLQAAPRKKK